jgi:Redoxin
LQVGDAAPAFSLEDSHDHRVSSAALRGRPIALRLTRTMGSGVICPACIPGLDDLGCTAPEMEQLGVEVVVVVTINLAQAARPSGRNPHAGRTSANDEIQATVVTVRWVANLPKSAVNLATYGEAIARLTG